LKPLVPPKPTRIEPAVAAAEDDEASLKSPVSVKDLWAEGNTPLLAHQKSQR